MRRVLDRFEIRGVPTLLVEVGDSLSGRSELELVSVPESWEAAAVAAHLDSLSPEALAYLFPRPGKEKDKSPGKGSVRALHIPTEDLENRATHLDSAVCRLPGRDEARASPIPRSDVQQTLLSRLRSSVLSRLETLKNPKLNETSDVFASCNDTTAPLDT